jgi:hypothetical protein
MKITKEKQKLWQLLGDLPEKSKISVTTLFEREMETYIVEELLLSINSIKDQLCCLIIHTEACMTWERKNS